MACCDSRSICTRLEQLEANSTASLPSQSGNAGRFLRSNGNSMTWTALSQVAITGDYNNLTNKPVITGAEQVNSDWNSTTGYSQILNRPNLAQVAISGDYNDLANKPTASTQVNADWTATTGVTAILNKPALATVATTGNYSDLSGRPSLATVATTGSYNDLSDKPSTSQQVNVDWNSVAGVSQILNRPTLAPVATSGSYTDLTARPILAPVATTGSYDDLTNKPVISGGTGGSSTTLAGLRTMNTTQGGIYSISNRGGGEFLDLGLNDGVYTDNDGTIIISANAHALKRIHDGEVYAKWFGAVGDGVTDDIVALQKGYDYCESNSLKLFNLGAGDYYVSTPLIIRRGGTAIVGLGALLREESWGVSYYPEVFTNSKPFSGSSLIANKNSAAILIHAKAVDPIDIRRIQFKVKGDLRTVGTTTGIHLQAEWDGPLWPFIVEECNFRGFNYAIKIESPTQYCVAFMQVNRNAFSQNDECLYLADIPNSSVTTLGQRNLSWGLTFTHNKCHDNTRIVRGTFAKDLVRISDNNGEGNIAYIAGGYPEALIDLEITNCSVELEGNHFEGVTSAKCIKVSSNFVMSDGSIQGYGGTTQNGSIHRVHLKGNNFDGIYGLVITIEITGCVVFNYDPYPIYGNGIFIQNNHINNQALLMSPKAKTEGSTFKFPITGTENRIANSNSQIAWARVVKFNGGANMFLRETPLGVRQVVAAKSSRLATIAEAYIGNWGNDIKFIGATFMVNSSHQSDFLGGLFFSRHYRNAQNVMVHDTVDVPNAIYGVPNGWTFISTYLPNPFPANSTERSGFFGLPTANLLDKEILVASDYTAYGFTTDNPEVVPYFSDRTTITKSGTFYSGQSFKDGPNINFVIDGGTLGTLSGVTASSVTVDDDFITVNNSANIIAGHRIAIGLRSFWVIRVEGNIVRLDDTVGSVLTNAVVQYRAPVFTLDGNINSAFFNATNEVSAGGGFNIQNEWLLYKSGNSAYLRDLINTRMHAQYLPGINSNEALSIFNSRVKGSPAVESNDLVTKDQLDTSVTTATNNLVPLFIGIGESNIAGRAANTDAPPNDLLPRPEVQILNNDTLLFEALDIPVNHIVDHFGFYPGQQFYEPGLRESVHGWYLQLANRVRDNDLMSETVYLVQAGQGGSRISQWNEGGNYSNSLMTRIDSAKNLIRNMGKIPLVYVFYSQGINDALVNTPTALWKVATKAFHARIRKKLGFVPIVMTKFMTPYESFNAVIDEIVAEDDFTYAINTTDLSTVDANHWDYNGTIGLANRVIDKFIEVGELQSYYFKQNYILSARPYTPPTAGSYTVLEQQTFDAANDWTNFSNGTGTSALGTDGVNTRLHLAGTLGGSTGVTFKEGIFVAGDILRITLVFGTMISGALSIAIGSGDGNENVSTFSTGGPQASFIVNTAGVTGTYILIGSGNLLGSGNGYLQSILIEKQTTQIP